MVDLLQFEDVPALRMVRDLIRRWWGLELSFADERGCVLGRKVGRPAASADRFCRHALACSPIRIDGHMAGVLFAGGSLDAEPSPAGAQDLLRGASQRQGAGGASELASPMSAVELEHLCDLVELGAHSVADACRERGRARSAGDERRPPAAPRPAGTTHERFHELVGTSAAMQAVFHLLDKIARSESTVLIHGESGTGKELIARAIHYHGRRGKKAFVVQNCSAFNDNLLESALFGHVRGAFTGAIKDQKGLFEVADGGTFFLDEVGDMSPALQVKLLRVLQEGTLTPVGATKPVKVDVRIVSASHKDLGKMVERGAFREDLYYRINVLPIAIPPLRDRLDDLPLLIEHFLHKHCPGGGRPPRLAPEAMAALAGYPWPGNIRELENEVERLMVLGAEQEELPLGLLSQRIREASAALSPEGPR